MMKLAHVTLVTALILYTGTIASGQRAVEATEISEILEKLARQTSTTWIPAGTIEAKHQEYRAARTTDSAEVDAEIQQTIQEYETSTTKIERTPELQKMSLDAIPFNVRYAMANEHSMTSNVIVKYDGDRFYWEIGVTSRTDSVTPSPEIEGNYMVERFDVNRSKKRIFTWDGQQYTIRSVTANHAIVDTANRIPRAVNGPLTAGIIRWGYGMLSSSNLAAAQVSATEIARDGITQIEMTVARTDGSTMVFVLDPAKDYAVTSYTLTNLSDTITSKYYSGHRQVAGNWVPTTVLIEQHDILTDRLLRSEKWDFTVVDGSIPGPEQFSVAYQADTVVEYYSPISTQASVYHYSNAADTDLLLAEHLAYTATASGRSRNCATAAVKHAAARLGKSIPDSALAALVGADGLTTMDDLVRFARGQGLYGRAVRTDLATLRDLPACQAILHIPGKNHFVVLDHVDERDAWIVDLAKSTFYYRQDKGFLPLDWSEGTALLLSTQPIAGPFDEIDDSALGALAGGDGYSCTRLLQEFAIVPCFSTGYDCWGVFKWYYERWGCEVAPFGSCVNQALARLIKDDCVWDPIKICTNAGGWDILYMAACD